MFVVLGLCRFRPESFEHPAWFLMLRFGLLGVVVIECSEIMYILAMASAATSVTVFSTIFSYG